MFGYVIPAKELMSEAQWEEYHAAYCGLCHVLQEQCGFRARFLLNYDFTFLALLLRQSDEGGCIQCRRCIASPIKGRLARSGDSAMQQAADLTVLLVYWKLRDQLKDEKGIRKLPACFLLMIMHGMFRRVRCRRPELDAKIAGNLMELRILEEQKCPSIDRTADRFAAIMTAMIPEERDAGSRLAMEQLLYHLGRWVYLIDAWDDLKEDRRNGNYNPVALRFGLNNSDESQLENAKTSLERTLIHSENVAISAFHLMELGSSAPIIENILCAGLPMVRKAVFSGEWKRRHKQKKQELNRI